MSDRILVAGATGVIGRRVVPELIRRGHSVTAIGRTEAKRELLARMGATPILSPSDERGRISRKAAAPILARHDVVINLATHMPPSSTRMLLPWEWRENDRIRRDDAAALVDAAIDAGVRRFIQESFAPVYVDGGGQWIGETFQVRPARSSKTVLDAEDSAARFTASGGVGIVLRFAALYGPDAVLGDMINAVRRGWSPLPGAADAYWSSLSQEDAATATIAALRPSVAAGVYNVCDDEPLTRSEWVMSLAGAIDMPTPKLMPAWVPRVAGSGMRMLARSQRMSNVKFRHAARWSPGWPSARVGLARAAARWLECTEGQAAYGMATEACVG